MQSFLAIKKDIQKKQRNSKKWRFLLYIFVIYWNIRCIYLFKVLQLLDSLNLFFLFTLLFTLLLTLLLIEDVLSLSIFIFFHHIDWMLREENKIVEVVTNTQVDEWFSQNKKLIASFTLSPPLVPKKRFMYPWGVIDQDNYYQLVFIDFSKKDTLVILNIHKSEIHQYDEADTIEKLIYTIQKRSKRTQWPIVKQLSSSARFSIISSPKNYQ